ncbi:MAG: condensation domain-containing protein, partial [Giesbergeria sp.]
ALPGAVDQAALRRALVSVVSRHDQLRAGFRHRRGGVQQFVQETCPEVDLQVVDARGATEPERAVRELGAALAAAIALAGPLHAAGLVQLDGSNRLIWVIHHLVVDTVSWRILLRDLEDAYHALSQGKEPRAVAKTTSYQRFADQLEQNAASAADLTEEYIYWSRHLLPGAPRTALATPEARMAAAFFTYRTVYVVLSSSQTALLAGAERPLGRVEPVDNVLALIARALMRWLNRSDIVFDLESHARLDPGAGIDLTRTVGWFTALYPFHVAADAADNALTTLDQVRRARAGIPNEGRGFGVLRYLSADAAVQDAFSDYRAPDVNVNYLGVLDGPAAGQGWQLLPSQVQNFNAADHAPYVLVVQAYQRNGCLHFELSASAELMATEKL